MTPKPELKRSLTLPVLTLYGLGTTVGAGIYVLVGAVAGRAGIYAPVAFLLAAVLASLTALSFAELAARFPKSAGEAVYVREGLRSERLALIVGLLVVLAGTISSSAIAVGAVGYILRFMELPWTPTLVVLIIGLGSVAAWGIMESALIAAVITVVEIGGLLVVIVGGWVAMPDLLSRIPEVVPPFEIGPWAGVIAGVLLAFYAFIGFEDMVNVAEEVRDVRRTLPLAIVLTLVITTVIYLLVTLVAVLVVPLAELSDSRAPVALIFERTIGESAAVISLIAIVATLNGVLVQIIMASRVLYGLSRAGAIPALFGVVNPRTRTPLRATITVTAVIVVLATSFPIEQLAEATSLVALTIFTLTNAALVALKWRGPTPPGLPNVPLLVPAAGIVASLGFIGLEALRLWRFFAAGG